MKALQVFIVEDDIRNADIHQKLISKIEGFSVIGIAENFQDAKDLLPDVKPDLVLLDIFLPDGSGMELLWLIRQKLRHTDVMMITAAKEVEYVEQAIRAGAVDYLIKPIMFSRLKETLLNYRSYRLKVNEMSSIDQTDVDSLMAKRRSIMKEKQTAEADYPKGIDGLTLKKSSRRFKQKRKQRWHHRRKPRAHHRCQPDDRKALFRIFSCGKACKNRTFLWNRRTSRTPLQACEK